MNKKLMSLIMVGMLCAGMIGCSSEEVPEGEEKDTTKVEQPVEEKKDEEVKEEPAEEKEEKDILTIENDEDFKKYISSSLSDDKYAEYFNSIKGQTIEFDATVLFMDLREGYDTRFEMLLAPGDTSLESDKVTGPSVKIKDAAYGFSDEKEYEDGNGVQRGIGVSKDDKVTVKGRVDEYDSEKSGCLVIDLIAMKRR